MHIAVAMGQHLKHFGGINMIVSQYRAPDHISFTFARMHLDFTLLRKMLSFPIRKNATQMCLRNFQTCQISH